MIQGSVKGILTALLFILLMGRVGLAWTEASADAAQLRQVNVLLSGEGPLYTAAVNGLSRYLSEDIVIRSYTLSEWSQQPHEPSALMVTVGALATERIIAESPSQPLLSVMVPSDTFESLLQRYPRANDNVRRRKLAAIYLNQPPSRQLNLIQLLVPTVTRVGTLYDESSQELMQNIEKEFSRSSVFLDARRLEEKSNPLVALKKIYADIDVFLAIPGEFIFNRSTAKWMLYLSVRNKKPLVGFSQDFVSAGALAALYSTPDQLAQQAALCVQGWFSEKKLNCDQRYPVNFSLSINKKISELMSIRLDDEAEFLQQLQNMEAQ